MKPLTLTILLLSLTYTSLGIAQTCNPSITADAPDSRYGLNINGTATDKKTGLIWMRCALGQTWDGSTCTGPVQSYTWKNALQTAEKTVFAGLSDWRLPNQKELQSLVESRCYSPAINLTAFPNATNNVLWASSPVAYGSIFAWVVSFNYGFDGGWEYKGSDGYVRLVRSGQ